MKVKILLFTVFSVIGFQSISQPDVGEWSDYQSFAKAEKLVDTGTKIYCSTEGGLFAYNKTDYSILKMSGINGLSDVDIVELAYSKELDVLVIAYKNGNIDLLFANEIFNISDIKRKQLPADKTIYNVTFIDNLAYLSCGFGIVVLNIEKREIKDSYYIGDDGAYVKVMDIATDGSLIFAATDEGIFRADISNPNLQDFTNWSKETGVPNPDGSYNNIKYFGGSIIVNYVSGGWLQDQLYKYNNGTWSTYIQDVRYLKDMSITGDLIAFPSRKTILIYNSMEEKQLELDSYVFADFQEAEINPYCVILDDDGIIWVADNDFGLIRIEGENAEQIIPSGPIDNNVFSLLSNDGDMWITSGGMNSSWNNIYFPPQFQLYRNGSWTVFDKKKYPEIDGISDVVCITIDPNNPDHVYAGSWGGGILEFLDGNLIERYDETNSSLQSAIPGSSDPYVRVGGLDFDSEGNLWVSNANVGKGISRMNPDGTWQSYQFASIIDKFLGKVLVNQYDDKWIVVPRGEGLFVFSRDNTSYKKLSVIAYFTNGREELFTHMNDIFSIAEDLEGAIWVGTSKGVAMYSSPDRIWETNTYYANQPGLDLDDGIYHPLLSTETVTAIAIDGANRKWFGTKSSGVYLISDDGQQEINHFTTENSPLPSNMINDIAINPKTGEVFIGTDVGLISYRGEAIAGKNDFANVYVYPNPVRENYYGSIVVTGLLYDTDVKITDISGNLVAQMTSLGGQAVWDGKNLNGKRCHTGVYLVFLNDQTGEKTLVTKLLFIH